MTMQEHGAGASGGGCPVHGAVASVRDSLSDPRIQIDPNGFFEKLRNEAPVYYDEKIAMYLVSRYEDVQTVLRDAATYSLEAGYVQQFAKGFAAEYEQILKDSGGGYFPDAIMTDPPYHTRIRSLVEHAFTAHRVATLAPRITDLVERLINQVAEKAEGGAVVDVVSEFSVPLTTGIICEQLGFDELDPRKVQAWSNAVVAQIGNMQSREQMLQNARNICELQNTIIATMRAREVTPREDMISDLVHATNADGGKLTFEEAVSLIRALLIGGNETTAITLTNLFMILATRPDIAQQLQQSADDDRLLNRFVEELLRFDPPTRGLMRMTTCETELGGVHLPKGAHLLVLFSSACDDEREFACPRNFDLNRKNLAKHVAFGGGIHRCIGASLARMEIKVVSREVVRRLEDIRLTVPPDDVRYIPTIISHAIASLPVTFKRRQVMTSQLEPA
ncbi:MAG TPA: cytochrome P450 [Steroidobacteraceae bacterium]|nr:cytochrome P450 [Steroidobacteraceae bacterium]